MSLAKEIAEGRLFLYRVLQPERATLSILPYGDTWVMQECRGPNNENRCADCIAAVHQWLATAQGKTLQEIRSKRSPANPDALLDAYYPDEVEERIMWRRQR